MIALNYDYMVKMDGMVVAELTRKDATVED
jgi:hypothetical protein